MTDNSKYSKAYRTNGQLDAVNFRCDYCWHKFEAAPDRVEAAPEKPDHPWSYFASCPKCGQEAHQSGWEQNIMAAFGKSAAARTPEGHAIVRENLRGHPTPEETRRTRFNAMKHGLFAKVATYFPAKPGKYPHCETCTIGWDECGAQVACMRRTELFMRHHIAFETGDPRLLTDLRASLHASIQAIIDDMVLAIVNTGVEIRAPEWYTDKDGVFCLAEYTNSDGERRLIEKITAHPLIKPLGEFLAKANLGLGDLNMTPKAQDEDQVLRGHLDAARHSAGAVEAYAQQSAESLDRLRRLIEASHAPRETVLIEQQGSNDDE